MPITDHDSCEYSFGLMVAAQVRLGLYNLAQETITDTLEQNAHLLHPVNNEKKEETIRRFRSRKYAQNC